MKSLTALIIAAMAAASGSAADSVKIVGSSTVYPFSTVAAERFAQITRNKAPTVEATGSGGGLQLFCAGVGDNTPDITNSSRRMQKSEQKKCTENGVRDIIEVKIGYDGIVIAQALAGEQISLTRRELFQALARELPDGNGGLIKNPNNTWRDINPAFPPTPIVVYGPPPTSGTRDAFLELVMENGCASYAELKALESSDKKKFKAVCHAVREDGGYVDSGENDNLIIQKLNASTDAFGIFGFSFLDESRDKVRGVKVEKTLPTFDAIADGSYPVSRPLFFYVKKAHYGKTAHLEDFVRFFIRPEVMGEDGFLSERGLIPLPAAEYARIIAAVSAGKNMERL